MNRLLTAVPALLVAHLASRSLGLFARAQPPEGGPPEGGPICMPFGFMNPLMPAMPTEDDCGVGAVAYNTPLPMDSDCNDMTLGDAYTTSDYDVNNKVCTDSTTSTTYRYIISNGVIDHGIDDQENPTAMCEIPWFVKIPMTPTYSATISETQHLGIIGMAANGVPLYGAKEGTGENAVESDDDGAIIVPWPGHAAPVNDWHYHNPHIPIGGSGSDYYASNNTLLGYALDGYGIYGAVEDDSILDECNGRETNDGAYQYHVRTEEQVDDGDDYCNSDGSSNWAYILGCFHGSLDDTEVGQYLDYHLSDYTCDETGASADDVGFTTGGQGDGMSMVMGAECADVTGVGWFLVFVIVVGPLLCIWKCGPCKGTCPPRIAKTKDKAEVGKDPNQNIDAADGVEMA